MSIKWNHRGSYQVGRGAGVGKGGFSSSLSSYEEVTRKGVLSRDEDEEGTYVKSGS
jgi:hypothetical protein